MLDALMGMLEVFLYILFFIVLAVIVMGVLLFGEREKRKDDETDKLK